MKRKESKKHTSHGYDMMKDSTSEGTIEISHDILRYKKKRKKEYYDAKLDSPTRCHSCAFLTFLCQKTEQMIMALSFLIHSTFLVNWILIINKYKKIIFE